MALISKASLLMVPSTYEQGKLYNVLPSGNRAPDSTGENSGYDQTRADFDFDRGSNAAATRVNADGLIEKYRENLLLNTNVFNSGVWLNDDTTETSGFEGYDGTNNAWKLVGNTNASRHHIVQSISQGGVNAWSLYAKASGHNYIQFGSGSTVHQYVNFDLSDGSVGNIGSDFFSANAEDVGDGWYRLSVVDKGSTNGFYISLVSSKTAGWLESWAMPNATDGILIQNAQLESGMVSTDYLESTSVTGKAGVLIDLPRIDYSSGAGALLLEPSRQQLVPFSEYLGASDWGKTRCTIEDNSTTSPEGLINSAKMTSTDANESYIQDIFSFTGSTISWSFFAKKGDLDYCHGLVWDLLANGCRQWFNLNDGTVGGSTTFGSGYSVSSATIEDYGSGWYRCTMIISGSSGSNGCRVSLSSANTTITSAVNSYGYFYGLQGEDASYPTSYIPNHGESGGVTRAGDSMNATHDADLFTSGEGVVFMEFEIDDVTISGYPQLFRIENPSATGDRFWGYIFNNTDSGKINFGYRLDDNTIRKMEGSLAINTTTNVKLAMRLDNNNYAIYYNGTKSIPGLQYAGVVDNLTKIVFSSIPYPLGVSLKQVAVFNEALSDSELETLTTL